MGHLLPSTPVVLLTLDRVGCAKHSVKLRLKWLFIWFVLCVVLATFLIKVKSHRGEPINEPADTLAEERRTISDDDRRWDDRTDRMTFEATAATHWTARVWYRGVRSSFSEKDPAEKRSENG